MEIRIGGKYKLGKLMGKGSFGTVIQGVNMKTNEDVAIKLEKVKDPQPML